MQSEDLRWQRVRLTALVVPGAFPSVWELSPSTSLFSFPLCSSFLRQCCCSLSFEAPLRFPVIHDDSITSFRLRPWVPSKLSGTSTTSWGLGTQQSRSSQALSTVHSPLVPSSYQHIILGPCESLLSAIPRCPIPRCPICPEILRSAPGPPCSAAFRKPFQVGMRLFYSRDWARLGIVSSAETTTAGSGLRAYSHANRRVPHASLCDHALFQTPGFPVFPMDFSRHTTVLWIQKFDMIQGALMRSRKIID